MKFTTAPPSHDVESLFPFLKGTARKATRLHPRRESDLSPLASKIGGAIAWPGDEPVPVCDITGAIAVPLVQLNQIDVPLLQFPSGADLLQLVWFPRMYEEWFYQPKCLLFWRRSASLSSASLLVPEYASDDETACFENLRECSVSPEVVVEYPPIEMLMPEHQAQIHEWEGLLPDGEDIYDTCLSTCQAVKVGGYPLVEVDYHGRLPRTTRGDLGELLVMLSDGECYNQSSPSWKPLELRDLPEIPRIGLVGDNIADHMAWREAHQQAFSPLDIYLKYPFNIFIDRTVEPNQICGF